MVTTVSEPRKKHHGATTLPTLIQAPEVRAGCREAFGVSDVGPVRSRNEDHFLILDLDRSTIVRESSLVSPGSGSRRQATLLVVADGMGGHTNGELASAVAIDTIAAYAHTLSFDDTGAAGRVGFQRAVLEAQRRVMAAADRKGVSPRLGTTLTAALFCGNQVVIGHVGDSRAYLVRPGEHCWRLTNDHTLGAHLEGYHGVSGGRVAHVLLNAIGGNDDQPTVDSCAVPYRRGDRFVLCTDGLTDCVDDSEIESIVSGVSTAREAAQQLVDRALQNEAATDNITAIVAIA